MLLSKCRAKCPIITIYITPWLQLQEKNTGWDVDIENENSLVEPIQQAAAWSQDALITIATHLSNWLMSILIIHN